MPLSSFLCFCSIIFRYRVVDLLVFGTIGYGHKCRPVYDEE